MPLLERLKGLLRFFVCFFSGMKWPGNDTVHSIIRK